MKPPILHKIGASVTWQRSDRAVAFFCATVMGHDIFAENSNDRWSLAVHGDCSQVKAASWGYLVGTPCAACGFSERAFDASHCEGIKPCFFNYTHPFFSQKRAQNAGRAGEAPRKTLAPAC